jgi:zinc transport system ATP-binding protein
VSVERAHPAGDPLLTIEGLGVRRDREILLADVTLTVERGSIHLVVGPNGAGKSTLLRAILGQTAFTGRIRVHWRASGRIGFVPQTFAVDRTLPVTVEDFLALSRQRRPVCTGLQAPTRRAIGELLARVGLADLARRPLSVLSGGELRRVLLANALSPAPELLILDEPASGVDERAVLLLDDIVLALRRDSGTTALVVSHDGAEVRRLADRVTVLDRRVVYDGVPEAALGGGWGGLLAAVKASPTPAAGPPRPAH